MLLRQVLLSVTQFLLRRKHLGPFLKFSTVPGRLSFVSFAPLFKNTAKSKTTGNCFKQYIPRVGSFYLCRIMQTCRLAKWRNFLLFPSKAFSSYHFMNLTALAVGVVRCLNKSLQWNVNKEVCSYEKYRFSFGNYSCLCVNIANVLLILFLWSTYLSRQVVC
jgi:hypothetical protein